MTGKESRESSGLKKMYGLKDVEEMSNEELIELSFRIMASKFYLLQEVKEELLSRMKK